MIYNNFLRYLGINNAAGAIESSSSYIDPLGLLSIMQFLPVSGQSHLRMTRNGSEVVDPSELPRVWPRYSYFMSVVRAYSNQEAAGLLVKIFPRDSRKGCNSQCLITELSHEPQ